MANNLGLAYLIEGAQEPSILPFSCIFGTVGTMPVKVDVLRQLIFDNNIKYLAELAPLYTCLTLLKVVVCMTSYISAFG